MAGERGRSLGAAAAAWARRRATGRAGGHLFRSFPETAQRKNDWQVSEVTRNQGGDAEDLLLNSTKIQFYIWFEIVRSSLCLGRV